MAREIDREPASFARRAGAFVIDAAVVGFIWFSSAVVAGIPGDRPEEGFDEPWDTIVEIIILVLPAYWFVYQWVCNAIGTSFGKKLLSLSIEPRASSGPPGLVRGLLRTVGQVIGIIPLGLGCWAALWDPENAAWHDKMAGTRVAHRLVVGDEITTPAHRLVERDHATAVVRRLAERGAVTAHRLVERRAVTAKAEAKNLRFLCDSSPDATGSPYVELRRDGIRFEHNRSLRGIPYGDLERTSMRASGQIELRFKSRDMFDRPSHETVMLAVQDHDRFLLELEARYDTATGARLEVSREPKGLHQPPT